MVRTATCTQGPLSGGIGNVQTFLLLLLDNGDGLSVEMSIYPSGKRNFIREGDLVKYYSDHDEYIEVTFKEDLPSDG